MGNRLGNRFLLSVIGGLISFMHCSGPFQNHVEVQAMLDSLGFIKEWLALQWQPQVAPALPGSQLASSPRDQQPWTVRPMVPEQLIDLLFLRWHGCSATQDIFCHLPLSADLLIHRGQWGTYLIGAVLPIMCGSEWFQLTWALPCTVYRRFVRLLMPGKKHNS